MYDEYDDGDEGGASLGRKVALGLGVVAIAAAGFFAFKAVTKDDGGEAVGAGDATRRGDRGVDGARQRRRRRTTTARRRTGVGRGDDRRPDDARRRPDDRGRPRDGHDDDRRADDRRAGDHGGTDDACRRPRRPRRRS